VTVHHPEQASRTDEQRKADVAAAIKAKYPTAQSYEVYSSDQSNSGYELGEVMLDDGTELIDEELAEAVWEDLIWLRWGAFGDRNSDSQFEVDITTGRMLD